MNTKFNLSSIVVFGLVALLLLALSFSVVSAQEAPEPPAGLSVTYDANEWFLFSNKSEMMVIFDVTSLSLRDGDTIIVQPGQSRAKYINRYENSWCTMKITYTIPVTWVGGGANVSVTPSCEGADFKPLYVQPIPENVCVVIGEAARVRSEPTTQSDNIVGHLNGNHPVRYIVEGEEVSGENRWVELLFSEQIFGVKSAYISLSVGSLGNEAACKEQPKAVGITQEEYDSGGDGKYCHRYSNVDFEDLGYSVTVYEWDGEVEGVYPGSQTPNGLGFGLQIDQLHYLVILQDDGTWTYWVQRLELNVLCHNTNDEILVEWYPN